MEHMAEAMPETDDQALQHFLTNSPWNEREVMDHVAQQANSLQGGTEASALYLNESAFKKNGRRILTGGTLG